jgi:hypothetical protein
MSHSFALANRAVIMDFLPEQAVSPCTVLKWHVLRVHVESEFIE